MKIKILFRSENKDITQEYKDRFRKATSRLQFIFSNMKLTKIDYDCIEFECADDDGVTEDQIERAKRVLRDTGFADAEVECSGQAVSEKDAEAELSQSEAAAASAAEKQESVNTEENSAQDSAADETQADKIAKSLFEFRKSFSDSLNAGKKSGEKEQKKQEKPEEKETFGQMQRRIADLKAELAKKVKGQQHAIDAFVRAYFGAQVLNAKTHKGPLATFVFAGPPGCGKTYLAECAAECLKGRVYARFNMSEYGEMGAVVNGYEFSGKPGKITGFVKENPKSIILFDEIEKASQNNLRLFLQILDAGSIRDNGTGEEVSFRDAILIFTTNVARNLYEDVDGSNLSGITKSAIVSALASDLNPMTNRPYFPQELVSRWAKGIVLMFNRLEPYALKEIVLAELKEKIATAEANTGIKIECDCDKIAALIMYSVGGSGDARSMTGAVRKFIESELFDAVSQLTRRKMDVDKLRKISLSVDYKKTAASDMFEVREKIPVLFAVDKRYKKELKIACAETKGVKGVFKNDVEAAKEALDGEVGAIVLDVFMNEKNAHDRPSDLEDIDSDGVRLFEYFTTKYPEIPVYVINDDGNGYDDVAFDTFLARGAKGIFAFKSGDNSENSASLIFVKDATVTGNNFYKLARSSNILSYNCAQEIEDNGETLEIHARRFEIKRSVKAEDRGSVLADVSRPDVKFSDVIGAAEAKKAMADYVRYLKNPKKYTATGRKAPKGILLYGPPGTGKTMLAKALAGETDVTFIEKKATEFFNKYVGQGPENIREVFRTARRYAPSIIFIDEVDGFAKARTGSDTTRYQEELLTTFLAEIEGFRTNENRPVIVVCATNYAIKSDDDDNKMVLDSAFVRRFDKKILVGLPDTPERKELICHYLRENGVNPDELEDGINILAKKTVGYSHSLIKDIINAAIERAAGKPLTNEMLEDAQDTEEYGEKKEFSKESVLRTARHEAGHAIVSWACGKIPLYMTVVARGPYGGYVMHDTEEDESVDSKQELLDAVCCSLGGRAAEMVYYGKDGGLTAGASSDLRKATEIASALIGGLGMAENRLAVASCFGEEVKKEIYSEVNALMLKELGRAQKLIEDNKESVDRLVEALIERNSLDSKDIEAVLGKPLN